VRDALRDTALRTSAEETGSVQPIPPPVELQPARAVPRAPDHPVPPGAIPNADVIAQPAN
jgi:hypothetical protein